jgi:DNA mismatch repair protein MutL
MPGNAGTGLARIEVLPAQVADAIAAGEVVDRPAAVLKELVENAIDAGATGIAVRIEDAGRSLIEVVDDGEGIAPDELVLAFHRHATSKLRSIDELRAIVTLGFRGEALASIAAVAEVEAVSRTRGRGEGRRLRMVAGTMVEQGAAGSPFGTRISVRRLFFNTPARLQFLKQPATESAVMLRVLGDLALAHPDVSIEIRAEGRVALRTPGNGDLRAAFAAVYDSETAAAMLPVTADPVQGLLGPPSLHRATREHTVLLVNGRRIHHRSLAHAVEQAYRGLREPDRFPIAVLDLRLDPAEVDVNVHPTKREVRFRNEGAVYRALERACFHALRSSPAYQLDGSTGILQLREVPVGAGAATLRVGDDPAPDVTVTRGDVIAFEPAGWPPLTYKAQVLRAYLVAEAPDALVLVDQHAAHERVLFDGILRRLNGAVPSSQLSLVPQVVEVTASQLAAFDANRDLLQKFGFEAERFGHQSLRLTGVPLELPDGESARVMAQLLDDLDRDLPAERRLRETAALIACHTAVRFGDALTAEAAAQLLSSLASTDEPISCPHGRPTTLLLPDGQLRRLFKRP